MSETRKYPLILALIAILLTGSVGLFNYLADPYVLFDYKNADNKRLSRIDQFNYMRITKPWYMREVKATAVIVGSSRSARLHPKHISWADEEGYNLAAPGMTPQEILRFIRHAQAIQPLTKVMIGLDYEAFIRSWPIIKPGFENGRMARDKEDLNSLASQRQYASDIVDSLFSIPALSRSIAATTDISPLPRRYFKDGTWETTTAELTGRGGYVYIGKTVIAVHNTPDLLDPSRNLAVFAEILRFCHNNNIDTRLFFTPTHVFFVDLWVRLGYEAMWQGFHRQVVAINQQVAIESNNKPFPLWGFSHADGIVNEPIYRKREAGKAWYDDGVHTRVRLGKKMMNVVWGEKAGIGVQLGPENIDGYLADVIQMMARFNADNNAMVSKLHQDIGL